MDRLGAGALAAALSLSACNLVLDPGSYETGSVDAGPAVDSAPGEDGMTQSCTARAWRNLLQNPRFDETPVAWGQSPSGIVREVEPALPRGDSGTKAALFGGDYNLDQELTQQVEVPASATRLRLGGARCFVTENENDNFPSDDFLDIELRAPAGDLVETLASFSKDDALNSCSWTPLQTLEASAAHAGESMVLTFHGTSDADLITSFWIDSLVLEAFACP